MIKKQLTKFRDLIKNNWLITLILLVAIVLNILIFNELGYAYTLNSDDVGYTYAGITFFETGQLIMHGVLSAQIMLGMTFIVALFYIWYRFNF